MTKMLGVGDSAGEEFSAEGLVDIAEFMYRVKSVLYDEAMFFIAGYGSD